MTRGYRSIGGLSDGQLARVPNELPGGHAVVHSDPGVTAPIDDLLHEAVLRGATRLHLEFCDGECRVRLREPDGLAMRRFSRPQRLERALHALVAAAATVPDGGWQVPWRHRSLEPRLLLVDLQHGSDGASWQLRPLPAPPCTPTLDQLIGDAGVRTRTRDALRDRAGLIALSGEDADLLLPLADAITAECVAPDRKVLRLEAFTRRSIAGCVQVALDTLAPERQAASCRALLRHDADVIVADAVLPPGTGALLDALAAHRLVVRALDPGPLDRALALLRGDGANGAWLGEHLSAVLRVDRLRRLCARCRQVTVARYAAAPPTLSPARQLLAQALRPGAASTGCEHCLQGGLDGAIDLVDALRPDERVRKALREERFEAADARLRGARRAPAIAQRLVGENAISLAEARRFGDG